MRPDLPIELQQALGQETGQQSRRALATRAAALSEAYRAGGGSEQVRNAEDALAYALFRMPATFAATAAVLSEVYAGAPDFAPRSLIDAGAGPGTAAWAAAIQYPTLVDIRLNDKNPHLRALGLALLAASEAAALRSATYAAGDFVTLVRDVAPADLVIASYAVGELAPDALLRAADALWSAASDVLLVIEPGTPAGFARIRALRAHLLAQGAHALAPCPHDHPCPIVDPDWCHFAQRLPRSRDHRLVKGAALAFEDEKFSYVALARERRPRAGARVLAHPRVGKAAASAKLCTAEEIVTATAARRDARAYKARKGWRWGDHVDWPPDPP
jgi:ribosomal protein RSM22 (predicted rRNA methylase)